MFLTTFNFFIQFGKVIDIINEEKGAERAGNFLAYYYLIFLSSFANEFMAYGKIPGADTEVEIAQNTIDGFTKLYNETFVNNKDVPNNSTFPDLMSYFTKTYENRTDSYANARTVRNFFENSIKKQANRIAKLSFSGSLLF